MRGLVEAPRVVERALFTGLQVDARESVLQQVTDPARAA
jgi:hypothetical protein